MKIRLIPTVLLVFLISIVSFLLFPTFYFNELELGFRQNFSSAYIAIDKAEQGISLRQQGPESIDDETFASLGKAIENELDNALSSLEKASSYNTKQEMLAFLLPNKYKQYLELKQSSLSKYHQLSESFRNRKQNEHLMTETLMLVVQIDQSIYNIEDYDNWLLTLDQLPTDVAKIKQNADSLLKADHINQEFHDYLVKTADGYDHLNTMFITALENDSWKTLDWNELETFQTPEDEVKRMVEESRVRWDQRNQDHLEKIADNDQDLLEASNYFNENKLALDPLSRLFSIFSSKFPRIKTTENNTPTIIPENAPIELLSYAN